MIGYTVLMVPVIDTFRLPGSRGKEMTGSIDILGVQSFKKISVLIIDPFCIASLEV